MHRPSNWGSPCPRQGDPSCLTLCIRFWACTSFLSMAAAALFRRCGDKDCEVLGIFLPAFALRRSGRP